HDLQRLFQPLKIRDQHFDAAIGNQLADLTDRFGKDFGPAYVVVVAVYAGYDGMLQSEGGYGFGHAPRFIPVDRFGASFGHGAKAAAPGANIAEQHERGGLVIPALADVGALRRLADGVQTESARQLLQVVKVVAHGSFRSQPVGLGHASGRSEVDLNQ